MSTRSKHKAEPKADEKINGIDTGRLIATIEALKADHAKAKSKWSATTRWEQGTYSHTRISRYELGGETIPQDFDIVVDEPDALLGSDRAPNPQMILFAALNTCVLNTFVVNAAARGIRIEKLELDLEGELDLYGFLGIDRSVNPGYDELTLVCRVEGDGTPEQYQECLDAGTRYSPNFQSISKAVKVHYRIEDR